MTLDVKRQEDSLDIFNFLNFGLAISLGPLRRPLCFDHLQKTRLLSNLVPQ